MVSSDEEDGHTAWNLFLEVVGQSRSGMLVEGFLEDEELARSALRSHLPMDLLCQEMNFAWESEDCRKVGNGVLK